MASQETLLERLIPGDLEHQIPAAIQKVLPGGFRNRLLQVGLGLLITFGFAFLVRRWIERREAQRRALAPRAAAPALPRTMEPEAIAAATAPPSVAPYPEPLPDDGGEGTGYPLLARPHVALAGPVDQAMYASFRVQLATAPREGALVVSLSTPGGDPEVARLMGDEIRLLRDYSGRETLFLGKVAVHAAGTIFMAAFPADRRFLTHGTRVMLQARQSQATVALSGTLAAQAASLRARLHEIEESARIEQQGFRDIIAGSNLRFEDVAERTTAGWFIEAEEARSLGLVHDII